MPVQWINRPDLDFRGYSGTIASGRIKPGDRVAAAGSGKSSTVQSIVTYDGILPEAEAKDAVTLTLDDEIDVSRGDVLCNADERPEVADQFLPGTYESPDREQRISRINDEVMTTVIEVGVDVPDASIMVIEHAERFGLAQLHQLRGRVGRGDKASSCLLLYGSPLSATAQARLNVMRETEDGFRIAEEDLKLRGGGDLLGTRQSGTPGFHLARPEFHADLLEAARDDAKLIMETDPGLRGPRGEALRLLLYLFGRESAIRLIKAG